MAMPNDWPETILSELRLHTDREIWYRPHPEKKIEPKCLPTNCKIVSCDDPIESQLINAHATVVWTSNSANDSLLNGIPVFYCGKTIICNELALQDISMIEDPLIKERLDTFYSVRSEEHT